MSFDRGRSHIAQILWIFYYALSLVFHLSTSPYLLIVEQSAKYKCQIQKMIENAKVQCPAVQIQLTPSHEAMQQINEF